MGFTREELEAQRDRLVGDLLPDPGALRLLFVGINPGLWTAAAQAHFAHPGNRFYPALHRAGITRWQIDASDGMSEQDEAHLRERGIGITNVVARATARADELTTQELREGAARLERDVMAWKPRVEQRRRQPRPLIVAIVGLTAYRTAFGRRKAAAGRQPERLGGCELWVLPNPSGLNAHETVDSLAAQYAEAARAAGILDAT